MKLLRRVKPVLIRRVKESSIVTHIVMKKDRVRNEPGEELFLKIVRENDTVVWGVQCNESGVVMMNPTYMKRKLERVLWKGAIKRREQVG